MNLKRTTIAAAVAAALGTSSAFALTTGSTANITILQMGSSAVQPAIAQVWNDFCVAGTLTTYVSADGSSFDYFCTLKSVAPIPSNAQGQNLLYEERTTGGSVEGVNPVALNQAQTFFDLSTCGAGAASGTVTCTGNLTASGVPDVGISDVEPKLFVAPNLPAGFTPLSTAQLGNLHVDGLFQQVFQVAVGASAHTGGVTNITSSQLASVIGGLITDWHTIDQAVAAGTKIAVCLRTAGSGTQAGANALFLNNPCAPTGAVTLGTSSNLTFNSSTTVLKACMNHTLATNVHPGWELGILGLADGPKAGDTFTTINIDSVAPTAATAATGAYKYLVESTLQYRTSLNTTTPQGGLILALHQILSTPSSLATVNGGLPAPAFNAEQSATAVPTSPYAAATPVEWGTRGGSTCAPFQLNFPN